MWRPVVVIEITVRSVRTALSRMSKVRAERNLTFKGFGRWLLYWKGLFIIERY